MSLYCSCRSWKGSVLHKHVPGATGGPNPRTSRASWTCWWVVQVPIAGPGRTRPPSPSAVGPWILFLIDVTLKTWSSCESTIWICSVSQSGNEKKKCCCFTDQIRQESYLLVSSAGLDTSRLVFFWLVVVLSNCVQWYLQMHAWCCLSSWAIFITRCQTLQLSGSGFPC